MPIDPNSVKWDKEPQIDASQVKWDDESADPSLGDMAKGVGEAGLNFISGIPAALGGGLTYLGTLAASQNPDAALYVKGETEKAINDKIQFDPRSTTGKRYTENLGKGFEHVINAGGPAFEGVVRSIPFVGDDLAKDHDAIDAMGKAYAEMALNVVDPLIAIKGVKALKGREKLDTTHAAKIEPKLDPAEVKWDKDIPAQDRGIPGERPGEQGQLWSQEHDTPTKPIANDGQGELFGQPPAPEGTINYEKTFPFDLVPKDEQGAQRPGEMGLNMPEREVPDYGFEARQTVGGREMANSPARSFFLDPANRDKVGRPDEVQPLTLYHGTTPEAKAAIKESGKFDPNAGTRHYSYSEFGPDATYFTQDGGWWLDKEQAANNRAASYDTAVRAQLSPDANVRTIRTVADANALAKELGFENQKHMMHEFFVDGLDEGTPQSKQWVEEKYSPLREKLKEAGIDAIIVDRKASRHLDMANDQVVVFNHDKLKVDKDYHFGKDEMGDVTMMHPEATTAMVDALRRGDTHGVLDAISKNHEDVTYRNLAEYLKDKLDGINIRVHDDGILTLGDRHATGYFDPATRTAGYSRVGAASPHTVLHELVHALTSDFVNTRPGDLRVMGIKDLFNKLTEMGMQKEFPEVHNIKEFLAEAFSSPEFQDFLKQHKLYERSTWRRFMDNVKSILGFSSATRNHVTNALEHVMDLGKQVMENGTDGTKEVLKDAGMPGKLVDLMVVRDNRPKPTKNPDVTKLKVPGLKDAISDFKFDDRPMSEIINEARQSADIPNTLLEKLGQQLQAGGLFESLKTRNPVVKATYERITRASQEYAYNIKQYLTDPKEGLKAYMRNLTPDEKGQIHSLMILNEGKRELSNLDLRNAGMNEKQIAYYNKAREQDTRFFNDINARRAELGMEPIDHRVAHMAGRFMGDFARFMFDKDGKIIGRIAGNTKLELNRATKFMQERHPDAQMGKLEYNRLGRGKNPADRFGGLMEALNFLTKTDADVSAVMDSYKGYLQKDAVGYLNAVRHAKAKVSEAGGIKGSEGNKPWLDARKNAEEGMKAQLAYFEQGYKWMAMEKAVKDLQPLLGDKEVLLNTPNAAEWGRNYVNHALGREQGVLSDAANWTASMIGEFTGIGHTNIFKANAKIKHLTMQKFMGLLNIPFSITQMMQPFQVHPPMMALLKNRGLEFSATQAQIKAVNTYLHALSDEKTGKLSGFEKSALDYAKKMGIMDVKMADHTKDINESKAYEAYSKVADLNIELPEKLTRGTSFLFYSHILKDAGVPAKDIFGAAENLTNMTMVNYHPIERPMGYAKLGWLGDIASTLTRYKHNQLSQAAFYTREGIHNGNVRGYAPLASFLGTSLAFGGVMGFFGYNEADTAYQLATQFMGKPDTLTNVLFKHNTPELITHGLFSTLGLDMTTRFSNANVLPDSVGKAMMPYGSAVLDMAQSTGRLAMDPTSTTKQKQFVKSMAPQSIQGVLENQMFTDKLPDGKNLYVNPTDGPNLGKGRVYRSDGDMALRNFGFRDIRESKELAKNYSDTQIDKAKGDLAKGVIDKVKYEAMDGTLTPEKLAAYARKAATQYNMDPGTFVSELTSWEGARKLSQADQIKLRNALGGFTGAMRSMEH